MKLSKYTVFYDNYPTAGEYLAYNTRTQGVLKINKEVREFIGRVTHKSPLIRGELGVCYTPRPFGTPLSRGEYSNEEQSCLDTLLDSGIIVPKETDEDKVLEGWFEEIKFRPRPLHATILTTFKCNFACTYCFEESVKKGIATLPTVARNDKPDKCHCEERDSSPVIAMAPRAPEAISMTDRTADEVIEFLKHKAVEKKSHKIRLMFYGGEPLMNPGAIIRIASALHQWSAAKGIKFSFGMITNGSLVKKDIIEQLTPLGLTSLRITLDGDKEVHDRRRPYLDGRGSFEHIIKNIRSVMGLVKVDLGGNFDRDNLTGLHRLLDYLEQKRLNQGINSVLFAPVVSRLGADSPSPLAGEGGVRGITVEPVGCHSLAGELAEQGLKLQKELIQRGYKVSPSVQVSACPMTMDDSMLVIDPTGDLYKCEAFVGRPQFCVGHVRDNKFNHRYYDFITMKPWQAQECLECPYLPMCGGGCRYIAQLKHSDYTKPACDKEYYEKIFPQLLKMDYERGAL